MNEEIRVFVESLLDDWEQDEYQIDSEWGCTEAEHRQVVEEIAARRAEWKRLSEVAT